MNTKLSLADRQHGFSLLETMIAVAIISAASVIMFQTISVQFRFAERADTAVERGLSAMSAQSMARDLLAGLTPGWREREGEVFQGDKRALSGLTRNPLQSQDSAMSAFTLELAERDGDTTLRYVSGDVRWDLMRLPGRNYSFAYRGVDLVWRSEWPPSAPLDLPPFNDGASLPPPVLPRAIRLTSDAGDERLIWLIAADWRQGATPRLEEPTQ